MNLRALVPVVLVAVVAVSLVHPAAGVRAQGTPERSRGVIGGVPDTGQFLPNDAVLAKIDDDVITAGEFVEAWFNSLIEFRPKPDSAGLHEFLTSMINKEVLGRLAAEVNKPLSFEDRHQLRTHEERVLSNVLFHRMVLDSIRITREDVARAYQQFAVQMRLRQIVLPDEETAERVRLELLRGRIGWEDAVRRYSTKYSVENPAGDIGWRMRAAFDATSGEKIFTLSPGEISSPVEDVDGFYLLQCVERRPYQAPSLDALYVQIEDQLRGAEISRRSGRFQAALARELDMTYDTTAILYAASQFPSPRDFAGGELNFDTRVPEFPPADTGRVLARWNDGGVMTIGEFVHAYGDLPGLMRPAVNSFEAMVSQIQSIALEPHRVEIARSMGLERDSLTRAMMDKRLEQLRVEALYQDSILSRVWVSSDERRQYYEANLSGFFTYPRARYVVMHTPRESLADSLAARIRAGESAADVLAEEQAGGVVHGEEGERYQNEPGPFHSILFEQLRTGETTVAGPDDAGEFLVIHMVELDSGRQLSFSEAQGYIDESLQNIKAEALLKELIARHRRKHDIQQYPELLMRVRMVDPISEPSGR